MKVLTEILIGMLEEAGYKTTRSSADDFSGIEYDCILADNNQIHVHVRDDCVNVDRPIKYDLEDPNFDPKVIFNRILATRGNQ